jgi:hypothetical protein
MLQRRMDKESDLRKEEEHEPHARREDVKSFRHSISDTRHHYNHHHSPRHSIARAHAFLESESSTILSPIRHHRRRYG